MVSEGTQSHDTKAHSVQIEITAYIILAYSHRGDIVEAISLMKWLTEQRNHLGGFGSPQVQQGNTENQLFLNPLSKISLKFFIFLLQSTVVALQALARFAVYSGAFAIDLKLKISSPTTPFMSNYQINSTNYLAYLGQELTHVILVLQFFLLKLHC